MKATTWTARDGRPVTIRPIREADFELESVRRRPVEEIRRFADIDPERELALIAVTVVDGTERPVGVARYVKDEHTPDEAEFAVVLSDAWQRCGLGTKLLTSLVDAARSQGLRRLVATTLSANSGMLALARRMGFRLALNAASATITNLTLDL